MEGVVNINADFWRGRRVFVTGHTGFKGGWLTLWLYQLEATVYGYALAPPTEPALFEVARVAAVLA
jgi:CDP-glucose 4,6-dehydratase